MPTYTQKVRVPVRLSQPNLDPVDGLLALAPRQAGSERPETLLELLNSERNVIPFIRTADSALLLLTRPNIDWVAVGPGTEPRLVIPPDYVVTREQRVQLRFAYGGPIGGIIQWNDAGERNRLSDFLDWSTDFFAVKADAGTLIVNKQRVCETLVAEATPRPAPETEEAH